ncbi:MAG: manganese efflux pump [Limnochordaceae bacterium]|nr:manganese efflux pump [Limnochordaceae bacterium]
MSVMEAIALAAALGVDALSVAISIGTERPGLRQRWAVVFLFSVVQSLFFLGGHAVFHLLSWGAARWEGRATKAWVWSRSGVAAGSGWLVVVGSLLLIALGLRMIAQTSPRVRHGNLQLPGSGRTVQRPWRYWLTRLAQLLVLAGSVSSDAAVAGFGLGFLEGRTSVTVAVWITLVVAPMVEAGLLVGRWLERWVGEWAPAVGGCVLVALGLHLFWEGIPL